MIRGLTLLGLGAGLMYFYDPERGARRRREARDQLDQTIHELDDAIQTTTHELTARTQGLLQGDFRQGLAGSSSGAGGWTPNGKVLAGALGAGLLWKLAGWRSPIRPLMLLGAAGLVARGVMLHAEPGDSHGLGAAAPSRDFIPMRDAGWTPAHDESVPPTPVI